MQVLDQRFESPSNVNENTESIQKCMPSMMSIRSVSTSRNIQRCAVSRRISCERNLGEIPISITTERKSRLNIVTHRSSPSNARPLRAFHMSTMFINQSTKRSSSNPNHLTIKKSFTSRTIITTVLPSSSKNS